jgi:hypothetical protein
MNTPLSGLHSHVCSLGPLEQQKRWSATLKYVKEWLKQHDNKVNGDNWTTGIRR